MGKKTVIATGLDSTDNRRCFVCRFREYGDVPGGSIYCRMGYWYADYWHPNVSAFSFRLGKTVGDMKNVLMHMLILLASPPRYQAEASAPSSRGFMVSMHGVMFAVGYSLSSWIGFGCYFMSESGSKSSFPWRFPLAFQGAPALLLLLGSPWIPFSPRWLLQQGREGEARQVIIRLHRTKDDPNNVSAEKEFYQMKKQLELDRRISQNTGRFDLFKTEPNRKRAFVGFALMFGNQFTVSISKPSGLQSVAKLARLIRYDYH